MDRVRTIVGQKLRQNEVEEEVISLAIEEAGQVIKNYCNIREIPKELVFTWANMACDIVKSFNAAETGEPVNGAPASVNMGDTTVSVSNTQSGTGHVVDLDAFIQNYREQLNKFRRVKWEPF